MRDELKQDYTRRITSANKSQLVVIMYDMFDQYLADAKESINISKFADMHTEIRRARNVLSELIISLDMKYEVAKDFERIYVYLAQRLVEANIKKDKEKLEEALVHLRTMRDTWKEIMQKDGTKAGEGA